MEIGTKKNPFTEYGQYVEACHQHEQSCKGVPVMSTKSVDLPPGYFNRSCSSCGKTFWYQMSKNNASESH